MEKAAGIGPMPHSPGCWEVSWSGCAQTELSPLQSHSFSCRITTWNRQHVTNQ